MGLVEATSLNELILFSKCLCDVRRVRIITLIHDVEDEVEAIEINGFFLPKALFPENKYHPFKKSIAFVVRQIRKP